MTNHRWFLESQCPLVVCWWNLVLRVYYQYFAPGRRNTCRKRGLIYNMGILLFMKKHAVEKLASYTIRKNTTCFQNHICKMCKRLHFEFDDYHYKIHKNVIYALKLTPFVSKQSSVPTTWTLNHKASCYCRSFLSRCSKSFMIVITILLKPCIVIVDQLVDCV